MREVAVHVCALPYLQLGSVMLPASRGVRNVYYLPAPTPERDLALMRAIDELHLEYPFLGARQLSRILAREGHPHAGRLHVGTLMAKMGITALYRKPNTSKRHPGNKIYPYLLRYLAIERADHVWAMDITYLPMQRGFIYLAAVMDWALLRAAHRSRHGARNHAMIRAPCRRLRGVGNELVGSDARINVGDFLGTRCEKQ